MVWHGAYLCSVQGGCLSLSPALHGILVWHGAYHPSLRGAQHCSLPALSAQCGAASGAACLPLACAPLKLYWYKVDGPRFALSAGGWEKHYWAFLEGFALAESGPVMRGCPPPLFPPDSRVTDNGTKTTAASVPLMCVWQQQSNVPASMHERAWRPPGAPCADA